MQKHLKHKSLDLHAGDECVRYTAVSSNFPVIAVIPHVYTMFSIVFNLMGAGYVVNMGWESEKMAADIQLEILFINLVH